MPQNAIDPVRVNFSVTIRSLDMRISLVDLGLNFNLLPLLATEGTGDREMKQIEMTLHLE